MLRERFVKAVILILTLLVLAGMIIPIISTIWNIGA